MTEEIKEEIQEDMQVNEEQDFKSKYLRALADLENTRKRMQKEKRETIHFAIENTVLQFLPALDSLENALKFAKNSSEEVKNWSMGFQMILNQFKEILHSHGIVAFHSEGVIFDPYYHEAMEIVETNDHLDGTILEEFAKGYKTPTRTIRPAHVKVARNKKVNKEKQSTKNKEDNHE